MKAIFLRSYARIFARPSLVRWNHFLLQLSLRGLGILNYQNPELSGERNFIKWALGGRTSPLIIDIGANIGDYALMVRHAAPDARIICIEPHPKNIGVLIKRADLHAEIIELAVGDHTSVVDLFDYADDDGSSHASLYREVFEEQHDRRAASHRVNVITLDQFCESNGITHIDLLKIDIEGHELAALKGAEKLLNKHAIEIIHFEFNEMNIISRVFMRDFRKVLIGYNLFRLLPNGMVDLKNNGFDELFAYQNIIALRVNT